ncbi:hypothetical protein [Escherichia phage vB-Eco-KMB37]|nr:hypothetical protein [Escherichia phage vB-Eco-KMB37]
MYSFSQWKRHVKNRRKGGVKPSKTDCNRLNKVGMINHLTRMKKLL